MNLFRNEDYDKGKTAKFHNNDNIKIDIGNDIIDISKHFTPLTERNCRR